MIVDNEGKESMKLGFNSAILYESLSKKLSTMQKQIGMVFPV